MVSHPLALSLAKVGCGKSSLLQALLGEMHQQAAGGAVVVNGSIAYTAQVRQGEVSCSPQGDLCAQGALQILPPDFDHSV